MHAHVRDHIPLEQGLRPLKLSLTSATVTVRDHIPLEQGLRRIFPLRNHSDGHSQRPYSIRTRIKTNGRSTWQIEEEVRDHIPLEQGLRPNRH